MQTFPLPNHLKGAAIPYTLAASAEREQITKTALIIVGDAVAQTGYERSKLYDPGFTTEFRQASVKEET